MLPELDLPEEAVARARPMMKNIQVMNITEEHLFLHTDKNDAKE